MGRSSGQKHTEIHRVSLVSWWVMVAAGLANLEDECRQKCDVSADS